MDLFVTEFTEKSALKKYLMPHREFIPVFTHMKNYKAYLSNSNFMETEEAGNWIKVALFLHEHPFGSRWCFRVISLPASWLTFSS